MEDKKLFKGPSIIFFILMVICIWVSLDTIFAQDTSGDYDVVVGGSFHDHDMNVLFSFIDGYISYDGSVYPGTIKYQPLHGFSLFGYAENNGYEMVIYSYGGANYYAQFADNYTSIVIAMPAGSNSFQHVFFRDIETSSMLITAAGADTNVTGYATEFHSIDPITPVNLSSFANGYIAGQIVFIAVTLGISVQEARLLARETGSRGGVYDFYSGYGLINIESAISPSQMVQSIINKIEELVITGILEVNHAQPLITKLENALNKIERNKITPAINQINAFINQVNAYINSGILSEEYGQPVIVSAEKVITKLMLLPKISPQLNEDNYNIPDEYGLKQNYPNPFNPSTTIEYIIPEAGYVTLIVYDVLGNKVATLVDNYITNNNNKVIFNASGLTSGIYIYILNVNGISINKKLILLK